ncbi:hypothetical protein ACS0TY_030476 [Phlomoides rotata]
MLQIILLWCFVVDSQGGGDSLPCISKLMPCQPYLKRSSPPPPTCCLPLNQIVADDRQCVCAVFNNVAILKSFNVTQDDALNLAKTCGANPHHTSLCGKGAMFIILILDEKGLILIKQKHKKNYFRIILTYRTKNEIFPCVTK